MKRTGIKRGRKRLPQKRKVPRKHDDLKAQRDYREANQSCELTPWLHRNIPRLCDRSDFSLELHHIIRGSGRYDYPTNFIRLSCTVHYWLTEVDAKSGISLCLWRKMEKQELNLAHLEICCGVPLWNYLQRHKPNYVEIVPLWEELLEFSKETAK